MNRPRGAQGIAPFGSAHVTRGRKFCNDVSRKPAAP